MSEKPTSLPIDSAVASDDGKAPKEHWRETVEEWMEAPSSSVNPFAAGFTLEMLDEAHEQADAALPKDVRDHVGDHVGMKDVTTNQRGPSLGLLTAIVAGVASEQEQRLWEERFASDPMAQEKLRQVQELAAGESSPLPLFARGQALLDELSPLPDEFWQQAAQAELIPQEAVSEGSPSEEAIPTAAPSITLDPQEGAFDEPAHQAPVQLGQWQWMGPAMALVAALVLMVQWPQEWLLVGLPGSVQDAGREPPKRKRPGASMRTGSAKRPFTRLAPARASGKGLTRAPAVVPEKRATPAGQAPVFQAWSRRRGKISRLPASSVAFAGDELKFRYRHRSSTRYYLLLFMIDHKGQMSPLYPGEGEVSMVLPPSKGQFLQGGAELTSIKVAERIFVCLSKRPVNYSTMKQWFGARLKRQPIQQVTRLPSVCLHQQSWLLQARTKPQRR